MAHFYSVTNEKSSSVSNSVYCSFCGPSETNLILAKGNVLEIYSIIQGEGSDSHSLTLVESHTIFGYIVKVLKYRPESSATDYLFLFTAHKHFCVIKYDESTKSISTPSKGNLNSFVGRQEDGYRVFMDPNAKMIGMCLYEGHVKILPMQLSGGFTAAYDVRLADVVRLIDIVFLYGYSKPVLCILSETDAGNRNIRTYTVENKDKDLVEGPWKHSNLDDSSYMLIPVPTGGVLVVGERDIVYFGGADKNVKTVSMDATLINAYECIDPAGQRFLLGDCTGRLSILALCQDDPQAIFSGTTTHESSAKGSSSGGQILRPSAPITSIVLDQVGKCTIPATLTYFPHAAGHLFIGSQYGDSEFIQLLPEPDLESGSYIKLLDTMGNIGPVLDMIVLSQDKQSQKQIVTCSGAYGKGSLRVISSGIGLTEQAELEVEGVTGIWSLRPGDMDTTVYDKYLIQSFSLETKILAIDEDSMEEMEMAGFDGDSRSLYCGNMKGGCLVQVTPQGAHLIDNTTFERVDTYSPDADSQIVVANGNANQLVVAMSGGHVTYLQIDVAGKKFKANKTVSLETDVAALDLSPLSMPSSGNMDVENGDTESWSNLVALAMWTDATVRLLALPSMEEVCRFPLHTDVQARDVLLVSLENVSGSNLERKKDDDYAHYLMLGLGDGTLLIYSINLVDGGIPTVETYRKAILGTKPLSLTAFRRAGRNGVFACGERPTVISRQNGQLLFTIVNSPAVLNMVSFHCELFPECIALTSLNGLLVGAIDEIQRLHVRTFPLPGDPRRIAHHASSGTVVVAVQTSQFSDGVEVSESKLLFLDDTTFDCYHEYSLDTPEVCLALTTVMLSNANDDANANDKSEGSSEDMDIQASANNTGPKHEVLVAGTAYGTSATEVEKGRILTISIAPASPDSSNKNRVTIVDCLDINGQVFCLAPVSGRLCAGVGAETRVYAWHNTDSRGNGPPLPGESVGAMPPLPPTPTSAKNDFNYAFKLNQVAAHSNNVLVLYLRDQGEFIVAGDIMRSMTVLKYTCTLPATVDNPEKGKLEEIARDYNTNYMRSVEIIGGDHGTFWS